MYEALEATRLEKQHNCPNTFYKKLYRDKNSDNIKGTINIYLRFGSYGLAFLKIGFGFALLFVSKKKNFEKKIKTKGKPNYY